MFKKILVANRGLVAAQCVKAVQELGIPVAVVYEGADLHSAAVRSADEAYELVSHGSASPYVDVPALLDLAERIGADAVHPGYGYLAHDENFAKLCRKRGITPIGPQLGAGKDLSNKPELKRLAAEVGLRPLPGSSVMSSFVDIENAAKQIGYPLLIKSVQGFGGKGIRAVYKAEELRGAYDYVVAQCEQNGIELELYVEKFLPESRLVEFPVLRDKSGRCLVLPSQECAVMRRFQKLLVESPAPALGAVAKDSIEALLPALLKSLGLVGFASVEFLMAQDGQLYFLEVNPNVQPSHGVTGSLLGVDLLREQVDLLAGGSIDFEIPATVGHAIGAYVLAMDPDNKFAPSPGRIERFWAPTGTGVAVQAAVSAGDMVGVSYDPMVANVVVRDRSRTAALRRMRVALDNLTLEGISTTLTLLRALVSSPEFEQLKITQGALFTEERRKALMDGARSDQDDAVAALIAALTLAQDANRAAILEAAAQNQTSVWNLASRFLNRKKMEF